MKQLNKELQLWNTIVWAALLLSFSACLPSHNSSYLSSGHVPQWLSLLSCSLIPTVLLWKRTIFSSFTLPRRRLHPNRTQILKKKLYEFDVVCIMHNTDCLYLNVPQLVWVKDNLDNLEMQTPTPSESLSMVAPKPLIVCPIPSINHRTVRPQIVFLEENFIHSPRLCGQNVQYFKPNHLSLFELALLANVVHDLYPTYSLLGRQCYFYANLVYTAAKIHFGVCPCPSKNIDETQDMVYIIDSHWHLSNKFGRWKGLRKNILCKSPR